MGNAPAVDKARQDDLADPNLERELLSAPTCAALLVSNKTKRELVAQLLQDLRYDLNEGNERPADTKLSESDLYFIVGQILTKPNMFGTPRDRNTSLKLLNAFTREQLCTMISNLASTRGASPDGYAEWF